MAEFMTEVVAIDDIIPHDNADSLEIAVIGGYNCITQIGQFKKGDLVAYIQEASVLPDWLIEELGLTGRLSGSKKNRVKAVRLRGVFSQGLLYPARDGWELGQDVSEELGIKKWEPPIPSQLAGYVKRLSGDYKTLKFDIENIKKQRYRKMLQEGDDYVVITEKLHGTWFCLALMPDGTRFVTSKGLSKQGIVLQESDTNLYWRCAKALPLPSDYVPEEATYILGEIFGPGVQDLRYGVDEQGTFGFRVFDIYQGIPDGGQYLSWDKVEEFCDKWGIQTVPVLYEGLYSLEKVLELTDGKECVSGEGRNIREGVVVRHYKGHIRLKSISEHYLLRKGKTTEYT